MPGLRSTNNYSLAFKLKVVREARRGDLSLTEISRKYKIKGHSTIRKWMRKLDLQLPDMDRGTDSDLRQRIKDLEKLLEYERLKRFAAEQLIEVAEEELKITIRKKSDSKQSDA